MPLTTRRRRTLAPSPTFAIRVASLDGGDPLIVRLVGAADHAAIPRLHAEFESIAAREPAGVVIELGALTYLSSGALGRIVALWDAQRRHNGTLVLTGASNEVRAVLDRMHIGQVIPVLDASLLTTAAA